MAELHIRIEEVEILKNQMQAVGNSIVEVVSDGILGRNYETHSSPSGNEYSGPGY